MRQIYNKKYTLVTPLNDFVIYADNDDQAINRAIGNYDTTDGKLYCEGRLIYEF